VTKNNWLTKLTAQLGFRPTTRRPIQRPTKSTRTTLRLDGLEDRVVPTITNLTITEISSTADTDGGVPKHVSVPGGAIVKVDFTFTTNNSNLFANDMSLSIGPTLLPLVSTSLTLPGSKTNEPASLSVLIPTGASIDTYTTRIVSLFSTSTVADSVDVVPRVTGVTSPKLDGFYKAGEVIDIDVSFNSNVTVTGTPQLALNSGGTADYVSGSGTNKLTFRYTVAGGQNSQDLDYDSTTALTLNGGTITDAGGNNVSLTLATPGTPGSLSNTRAIVIDTTDPTVDISAPSASITKNGPVTFTISYYDLNFDASTLSVGDINLIPTGSAAVGTITVDGTGNMRTVTLSNITGNGTVGISIDAGTASDLAGNVAPATGASSTFEVDNTPLAVNISAPSASITAGGPITYTINYTHPNFSASTLTAANITLNKTGTANGTVSVSPGSGPIRTVTISNTTGDGTLGISIAAGTAVDTVGNLAVAAGPSSTFRVQNTAPTVTISAPSAPITAGGPVSYTVTYSDPTFTVSTLSVGDITLNKTGTANGTVSVSPGSGLVRVVTISGITGDGTLGISIAAGTATDQVGNLAPAAGPSNTFTVDNTPLSVVISAPSVPITQGGPVTYTITYPHPNFSMSTLSVADITLNKTGTANGIVSVDSGTGSTRTVTISNTTGEGTLGISIAAGTAVDTVGNLAVAAGPSTTFEVVNIALFAIGGSDGTVRIVNANTGGTITTVRPLDVGGVPYTGLVQVALGDFNGDGFADLVVSAANPVGVAGLNVSKAGKAFLFDGSVLDTGTLTLLHTFTPFATTSGPGGSTGAYTNGLNIAAGDVNGDGNVDLIAGTRGISGGVGTAEFGRLVAINEGAATNGSADTIIGSIITPFGSTYQKGVVVAAGNLDGVGADEIAVTRGGPVAATNPNKSIKLKAYEFNGTGFTELDLNGSASGTFAPFPGIERDGRIAFVDPDGDGQQELVFSALDRTVPSNTQVRIAVFDVNTTTGLATAVSTGTGPSNSYLVGTQVQDHGITQVDLNRDGSSDLALITETPGLMRYLAPLTGAVLPGGFSLSITAGGVSIDGV